MRDPHETDRQDERERKTATQSKDMHRQMYEGKGNGEIEADTHGTKRTKQFSQVSDKKDK